MKKCPHCAELIQPEAKVCRYCGKKMNASGGCASVFAFVFVIAGFFFWPLWILAVLLFILAAMNKK